MDPANEIKKIGITNRMYLNKTIKDYYDDNVEYIQYENELNAVEALMNQEIDCVHLNSYQTHFFQSRGKYLSLDYTLMPTLEYDFALGIGMNEDDELHSIISKGLNTISFEDIALIFDSCIEDNETYYFEMLYYQHPLLLVFIAVVIVSLFLITLLVILYTRRIQKKNTELSIAKNAQSDFLSRMSHDMRTPMNGILGISYLAKDKTDVKEMQKDFRQIESSGNLLLNLINDTLEMNKIESGKLILNPELCNEHQIFDSIFDTIRPLAQKKNINFIINIQDINWKYLKIDYKKLQQIFVNIIGNSIKFTPEGVS